MRTQSLLSSRCPPGWISLRTANGGDDAPVLDSRDDGHDDDAVSVPVPARRRSRGCGASRCPSNSSITNQPFLVHAVNCGADFSERSATAIASSPAITNRT